MYGKEILKKKDCMSSTYLVTEKMMKILDLLIYLINLNLYKFCNISVKFEDTKMVDHILKIA